MCETARKTIRETTEDNNYIPSVSRGALQNGGGYATTKVEAKNPQKAYLCNHEYIFTSTWCICKIFVFYTCIVMGIVSRVIAAGCDFDFYDITSLQICYSKLFPSVK